MASKTVHKFFWLWDFRKEEQWLNEMAKQGHVLEKAGVCTYHMTRCQPDEYEIRMEFFDQGPKSNYGKQYIKLVEETGAEHICNHGKWAFFRQKTADGSFQFLQNIAAQKKHLDKIQQGLLFVMVITLVIGLYEIKGTGILLLAVAALAFLGVRIVSKRRTALDT